MGEQWLITSDSGAESCMSSGHSSKLDVDWVEAERLALDLGTIFDILEHGKGLADGLFKD